MHKNIAIDTKTMSLCLYISICHRRKVISENLIFLFYLATILEMAWNAQFIPKYYRGHHIFLFHKVQGAKKIGPRL